MFLLNYRSVVSAGAALVLFTQTALGHGHGSQEMTMDMDMSPAMNSTAPAAPKDYPPTYFAHPEHMGLIYAHVALSVVAWIFVLPVGVMLSITRSRATLPLQIAFSILNAVSIFCATVYNARTPDLYPNNAHHKIGWIITLVFCGQISIGLSGSIAKIIRNFGSKELSDASESRAFLLAASNSREQSMGFEDAQEVSPTSPSFRNSSVSTAYDETAGDLPDPKDYDLETYDEAFDTPPSTSNDNLHRLLPSRAVTVVFSQMQRFLVLFYRVVDRIILPFGFVALATGIITFARFFEGHEVFSGLAHWIKGGVFFWLGLFNLGRWSGAFAELGWAWNRRPRNGNKREGWVPTAEFVESSLILFYGSTNIFLEHLGNAGQAWSSQDLEHMSITVLFIGGGLCGILIESHTIRKFLNANVHNRAAQQPSTLNNEENGLEEPETYDFSLNPIPALVILILGIMMSSHQQSTMISSMVHKQWGNLLLGASLSRGLTYFLIYLRPPTSIFPSRPPTELLSAFGLIAGGIIFMASSSDTIEGMIHYDLDAMFFYTVTMGCSALLMAWELVVLAIKGFASTRTEDTILRR